MFPELSEIKLIRKKLDLTQHELAKKAGISQSLIAKIEAGKMDPTYTRARRIFETLHALSHESRVKAGDVMSTKIICAKTRDRITEAIKVMRKHSISQLPVTEGNELVGFISERNILEAMLGKHKDYVADVMDDRPPSISRDTYVDVVTRLLVHFPMVAVFDKQKMVGIITKSDIIGKM